MNEDEIEDSTGWRIVFNVVVSKNRFTKEYGLRMIEVNSFKKYVSKQKKANDEGTGEKISMTPKYVSFDLH
ncbi:hypothetical protein J437_LFUL007837 [Ladona fulva]|uniref:Uncharacterized protein n=1 Tax=Ladona fulva TaxID=123851 RepID=A0A8K0JU73_LADFU|nr:hypothetical protein J437_LFUL007837 [Ladona fulva]